MTGESYESGPIIVEVTLETVKTRLFRGPEPGGIVQSTNVVVTQEVERQCSRPFGPWIEIECEKSTGPKFIPSKVSDAP